MLVNASTSERTHLHASMWLGTHPHVICMHAHKKTSTDHPSCTRVSERLRGTSRIPRWWRPTGSWGETEEAVWRIRRGPSEQVTPSVANLDTSDAAYLSKLQPTELLEFCYLPSAPPQTQCHDPGRRWQIMNSLSQLSSGRTTDCFTPRAVNILRKCTDANTKAPLSRPLKSELEFIRSSYLIWHLPLRDTHIHNVTNICPLRLQHPQERHLIFPPDSFSLV